MISHDIHVHTMLSKCSDDPKATPENYIKRAKELGLKVIGFSDHFWDTNVAGASEWYSSQNFEHIMQIKQMNMGDQEGIKVLIGCETEYCGNGKIGITPQIAQHLDFVLVPMSHLHMKGFVEPSWVKTPKDVAKVMVNYFKDVVEFDFITGIAHPFDPCGYNNRDEILSFISDDEFMDCFGRAAEKGISIEINDCHFPSIKDTKIETYDDNIFSKIFSIAKSAGCKFHLGTDAHSLNVLDRACKLEIVAEALGLKDEDLHPIITANA